MSKNPLVKAQAKHVVANCIISVSFYFKLKSMSGCFLKRLYNTEYYIIWLNRKEQKTVKKDFPHKDVHLHVH